MKLFKESVILLGFIVTRGETRTNPEKVRPIKEFPEPKNLFSLSSSSIWQAITETSSKISPQLLGPLQLYSRDKMASSIMCQKMVLFTSKGRLI